MTLHLTGTGIDFTPFGETDVTGAGATSELLDDYEEGTWTPAATSVGGSSLVYANQRYTKIARSVLLHFQLNGTALVFTANSSRFAGSPYAPASIQSGSWVTHGLSQAGGIYSTNLWMTAMSSTNESVAFNITYDM